jgi:opacity protein-like surface antigen
MKNRLLIAAVCAVLLAACGHKSDITVQNAVSSGAAKPAGPVVAAAGTTFNGTISTAIGSKTSKDGDTFTLTETKGGPLAGSTVDGHVVGVVAAGPLKKPAMTLVFDDIRLADGTKEPISIALISQGAFDPKSHHLRTIGMMIGGAMAGHHVGKGHAMLGAIGGYAASQALKTDIAVPAGTAISLRFTGPVTDAGASAAP